MPPAPCWLLRAFRWPSSNPLFGVSDQLLEAFGSLAQFLFNSPDATQAFSLKTCTASAIAPTSSLRPAREGISLSTLRQGAALYTVISMIV